MIIKQIHEIFCFYRDTEQIKELEMEPSKGVSNQQGNFETRSKMDKKMGTDLMLSVEELEADNSKMKGRYYKIKKSF